MFIASLTIWLVCRNIVKKPDTDEVAQFNPDCENEELVSVTVGVFLLRAPGPPLWDCVESMCRKLWGSLWGRPKWALSLYRAACGCTLTPTPWWWGHRWWACECRLSSGPHSGVRSSLLERSSPQLTIWPHGALVLYQMAKPERLSPALQPTCSTAHYYRMFWEAAHRNFWRQMVLITPPSELSSPCGFTLRCGCVTVYFSLQLFVLAQSIWVQQFNSAPEGAKILVWKVRECLKVI